MPASMEAAMTVFEGGCLCRAVRFRALGPSLFVAHCHCRWCRAAHGAAFVTWLGVAADGFELMAGGDGLRWFASSEQSRRGFCGHCGTTMLYRSELSPGEVHIALATIDGAADRAPQLHVFTDQAVEWVVLGDELPRYDSDHPGLAKYRAVRAPGDARGAADGPGSET